LFPCQKWWQLALTYKKAVDILSHNINFKGNGLLSSLAIESPAIGLKKAEISG
jgi:hypothetical protein